LSETASNKKNDKSKKVKQSDKTQPDTSDSLATKDLGTPVKATPLDDEVVVMEGKLDTDGLRVRDDEL